MKYPTKKQAEHHLHELLMTLHRYRSDLEGDAFVAENARRMVRTQNALIRRHCEENGLPRPHDVPETD